MAQLFGYEWIPGGSKHVVYLDNSRNVIELFKTVGNSWQVVNVTQTAENPTAAPPARFLLNGYGWDQGKQITFVGDDLHIHELYSLTETGWQHADLTSLSSASRILFDSGVSYGWQRGQSKQVVFFEDLNNIRELSVSLAGGGWQETDLTAAAGVPAFNFFGGYAWESAPSKQVVFNDTRLHIHELSMGPNGAWQPLDLTNMADAPPGILVGGYAWESGEAKQVLFTTGDGHIHELAFSIAAPFWQHFDLTVTASAPEAWHFVSNGFDWPAGVSKQLFYLTGDGHIHELSVGVGLSWTDADLTLRTLAPPVPRGNYMTSGGYSWEAGSSKQLVFATADGRIHELSVSSGGEWQHADLTDTPGAPLALISP